VQNSHEIREHGTLVIHDPLAVLQLTNSSQTC